MDLSLIVCPSDPDRDLARIIRTLGQSCQRGLAGTDYEIVVVDGGSPHPVEADDLRRIAANVRVIRTPGRPTTRDINSAMAGAGAGLLGLFMDGARMASPGLLAAALKAHRADPSKVIGALGFDPDPGCGAGAVAEEDGDGYARFGQSVLAEASAGGWFGCLEAPGAVFLDPALWEALGGIDPRFAAPGGGGRLDLWNRAVAASDAAPWILLGEGTFRQAPVPPGGLQAMRADYAAVRGVPWSRPDYRPQLIGALDPDLAARFSGHGATPPRQAHSVRGRPFRVGLPTPALENIQAGSLKTRYRGRRFAKNPFDLVLYLRLIEALKPRTIIEIGTSKGGSALWFRDQCRIFGLDCRILTMDITPPRQINGVSVFEADAFRPEDTFPHEEIAAAAHPWIVTEDSAHFYESTRAVLEYFDPLLQAGDYIVVEDGVVADLPGPQYRAYEDGPNRAVRDFLETHPEDYRIDAEFCDFFGHNVTYCPNAWLVRN